MTAESRQPEQTPAPAEPAAASETEATKEPANGKHKTVKVPEAELEQLKARAAQADENWERFLRTAADLDNYRKRVARERDEWIRNTRENVIGALLPALDNLERALGHADAGTPLHEGLLQVQKQFASALAGFGLVEFIAEPGSPFDPNAQEAVGHVESADHADGVVIQQVQSGYKLGDRLLRPARVIVSKGPPQETPGDSVATGESK